MSGANRTARKTARKATNQAKRKAGEVVKSRRAQFMDGDLTVRDLSYEELSIGKIANHDGTFEGRQPRMPDRFLAQLEGERIRRIKQILKDAGPEAAEAAVGLMTMADSDNVRLAAAKYVMEHNIGKVPDVVHVGAETGWDRLQQTGFHVTTEDEGDVTWEDDDDGKGGTVVSQ